MIYIGQLSIASLYGQHIEDGLNFSCIAFMDGLFFFFLAAHVPGPPL